MNEEIKKIQTLQQQMDEWARNYTNNIEVYTNGIQTEVVWNYKRIHKDTGKYFVERNTGKFSQTDKEVLYKILVQRTQQMFGTKFLEPNILEEIKKVIQ